MSPKEIREAITAKALLRITKMTYRQNGDQHPYYMLTFKDLMPNPMDAQIKYSELAYEVFLGRIDALIRHPVYGPVWLRARKTGNAYRLYTDYDTQDYDALWATCGEKV